MAERQQHPSIGIVADGPAGQRFAERLGRQGVQSHAVASDALAEQAQAGQLFLAPLGSGAAAVAVVQRGAHVCLLPPWPLQSITLGGAKVGAVEVEQRGMAYGASALDISGATPAERQSFKILYRERLVGDLGVTLAESEAGEPLLASLPRTSNRHGYLLVTTLQLSVASAQTRRDDVARLITHLLAWLARHDEPVGHTPPERQQESEQRQLAEDYAPLVALALRLLLSAQPAPQNSAQTYTIQREAAQAAYAQICQALGQTADSVLFHAGWAWLEAHGIVLPQADERAQVDREALERYGVQWQLGPRLRRLRRADGLV